MHIYFPRNACQHALWNQIEFLPSSLILRFTKIFYSFKQRLQIDFTGLKYLFQLW